MNLVTKSGTNDLHGTLYEFDRNNNSDARSEFETGAPPPLRQNQFGYAVGGPVYFPHLYNGRNKTFWFASYEGWRISSSSGTITSTFPTLHGWLVISLSQSLTRPRTFRLQAAPPGGRCTSRVSRLLAGRALLILAIADKFYPAPINSTSINGNFEGRFVPGLLGDLHAKCA